MLAADRTFCQLLVPGDRRNCNIATAGLRFPWELRWHDIRHVSADMTPPQKLLDRVRDAIRTRHYSRRTEEAYVYWIRRYIVFHEKKHPSTMGAGEIGAFLTWLAVRQLVSASTQNQALSALLFLYREVLGMEVGALEQVPRARVPARVPVVLSRVGVFRQLEARHAMRRTHQTRPRAVGSGLLSKKLGVWRWHLKILADLLGEFVVDFVVSWDA